MKSANPSIADKIAAECIAVRVRALSRVVTKVYDDALRPLGLKASQMNILVAAAKLGVARPAEVCRHLHLDVSTLSRNVERMKSRGWLEAVPDDADGRAQPFRLTKAGRSLLRQAAAKWESAQQAASDLLGQELLGALRQSVERLPADQ